MSTKIYGGFRFDTTDIAEAYRLVDKLRPAALKKIADTQNAYVAKKAQSIIDEPYVSGKESDTKSPIWTVVKDIRERQREVEKTGYRDPEIDFEFSVCIIPVDSMNIIVGMVFTEQPEWRKWFLKQKGVRDFAYWDNTDHPKDISETEWDFREQVWDEAFSKGRTPAEVGFTLQLHPSLTLWGERADGILKKIDPKNTRAEIAAQALVRDARIRELQPNFPNEGHSTYEIMHAVNQALDYVRSDEGQQEVAKLAAELAPRLPDITKEMLCGA